MECFFTFSVVSSVSVRAVFIHWCRKLFGFASLPQHDWPKKKLVPIFHPIRNKTGPLSSCNYSSFEWFIELSVSFVIGWSDNFNFALASHK